jgi:hypothetical protein
MKKEAALRYVGFNINYDREKDDFYSTPSEATQALCDREKFKGDIWECACGDGAMSKVLIDNGCKVYSSDLIDRGYGETPVDFLKSNKIYDNIVTNPPFVLSTAFIFHALKHARNKVVVLNKISYLEGVARRKTIFNQKKLKKVWVFTRRVAFRKPGTKKLAGGLMAFGWFIYDVNYNGLPTLDWI